MKSVWRGSLSFGLVNIPVRLYHASRDKEFQFHLLHKKDLSEIRYARICKTDGKEIPWQEVVKGYELENGQYILFTDEDFEKANPRKVKTIAISDFVSEEEIDPMYLEMPYYLEPEKGSAKAYNLLCEALKKSNQVAIGTFVFRNHEHLGLIKAQGNVLVLIQMRFHENMLSPKELNIPKGEAATKKEVDVALQFIKKMTKKFDPSDYSDTYTNEINQLIKEKAKGRKVGIKKGKAAPSPKVHDIMALLKQSLEIPPKTRRKKRKSA